MFQLTKEFVLAGKAIFTLEIPADFAAKHTLPPHYTVKVSHKEASAQFPEAWFVNLLTGPNNLEDYTYFGMLNAHRGEISLTRKSQYTADSMVYRLLSRTFATVWSGDFSRFLDNGFTLHHEGRCGRCGRVLTVPSSIETGLGPECAEKSSSRGNSCEKS